MGIMGGKEIMGAVLKTKSIFHQNMEHLPTWVCDIKLHFETFE
jgi:hypothetical protein